MSRRPAGAGVAVRGSVGPPWTGVTVGVVAVSLLCAAPGATCAQTAPPASATDSRPQLQVRVDSGPVHVGDRVTLRLRARLPAGARLADAQPALREPLPDGARLLHVDSLRLGASGDATATAIVVFFRPGSARVPPMAATYRAAPDAPVDTLIADAVAVTVTAVVPVGTGTLRDIKDIEGAPIALRTVATAVAGGVAMLVLVLLAGRIRERRRAASSRATEARETAGNGSAGPYDIAITRLAAIAAAWDSRGDVDAHYEGTADVLRRYLAAARGIPALERTTAELVGVLRASAPGTHTTAHAVLDAADLVKFARYAPRPPAPTMLVTTARSLLVTWHADGAAAAATLDDGAQTSTPDDDHGTSGTRGPRAVR